MEFLVGGQYMECFNAMWVYPRVVVVRWWDVRIPKNEASLSTLPRDSLRDGGQAVETATADTIVCRYPGRWSILYWFIGRGPWEHDVMSWSGISI